MVINILSTVLVLSLLGVFIYVYAIPWLKGTMVKDDNANCASPGPCKKDAWCCKDPRQGDGFCVSTECSKIRLEQPSEDQIKFFKIYVILTAVLLLALVIIKQFIR